MPNQPIVVITGATGRQGGAVARELTGKGFRLRAMTRKPESDAARALGSAGVTVVPGDFDDEASLRTALDDAWGVFSVQNSWEAGVEKEEEHGKRLARVAIDSGVQHFVYSSVASAHRKTGIPHFDSKWRIEEAVRELGFSSHVILRPAFFMENLLTPFMLNGNTLATALDPATVLQVIAVEDVGRYGARAFTEAGRLSRREIDLAGDAVTMPAAAEALGAGLGRTIDYRPIPIEEVRKQRPDVAQMLEWFGRVGFNVDIKRLEQEFGVQAVRLRDWAARQRT